METSRWTNPSQPQTLHSSVVLLYMTAVLGVLFGGLGGLAFPIAAARVAGGWGCANERKWGYQLAVAVAVLPFVFLYISLGPGGIADNLGPILVGFAFDIVLLALLLHPQTRAYQRIWFR
jgi:hypothetical protein